MEKNDFIFGIRAVIEAVEAGRQIDKLLVKKICTARWPRS